MTSHGAKPTIVLVQGSFQLPDVYHKLADALRDCGYEVVQPVLPSLTGQDKPDFISKSLEDDALAVRSEIQRLVDQGRFVFVVMHSYGGLVGTEAVTQDLAADHRRMRGAEGGVRQSINGSSNDKHDVGSDGRFVIKTPAKLLYHDLPDDKAEYWESRTVYQAPKVQEYAMTNEAFDFVPATFLVCEKDRGPPPEYQRMCGTLCRDRNANSKVLSMDCGHSPMLSHTSELTAIIDQAVKSVAVGI
ncbi:hypothetical protein G7054_g10319 [Neopestalotiopsis clavispora]|nr:hypothetical protein G7054_g10319 [Neopestalotiopsis clavispora]